MPVITEVGGLPMLYGPYIVDYLDIPTDGSFKILWVPRLGDIVLGLFGDPQSGTVWDHGQVIAETAAAPACLFQTGSPHNSGIASMNGQYIAHTNDPIRVRLSNPGDDPVPSTGHVELYALVARALAP